MACFISMSLLLPACSESSLARRGASAASILAMFSVIAVFMVVIWLWSGAWAAGTVVSGVAVTVAATGTATAGAVAGAATIGAAGAGVAMGSGAGAGGGWGCGDNVLGQCGNAQQRKRGY